MKRKIRITATSPMMELSFLVSTSRACTILKRIRDMHKAHVEASKVYEGWKYSSKKRKAIDKFKYTYNGPLIVNTEIVPA